MSEDCRGAARHALAELLEDCMTEIIEVNLKRMAALGAADRRNPLPASCSPNAA
jgi:hypothetical protein